MNNLLRQGTIVNIKLGPFDLIADGTAATALSILRADVRVSKNGGAWGQKDNTVAATHEENGYYTNALSVNDVDMVGSLVVAVRKAGAVAVRQEYFVLPAAVYDAWIGTVNFPSDVKQVAASTSAGTNLRAFFDGTGYASAGSVGVTAAGLTAIRNRVLAHSGLARGGDSTHITLATTAAAVDEYTGLTIIIFSGAGATQAAVITAYDPVTKIATVAGWPLGVNPANGSAYSIMIG